MKYSQKKILSIIVIEYNSLEDVMDFISTIEEKCSHLNYEIIISSNSMYPLQKQEEVRRKISHVVWIFNNKNGGFAYGMNRGMEVASGEYIIISNPDVRLLTSLDEMILFMEEHPMIGIMGPQILDKEGNIQDSFRNYITLTGFVFRHFKRFLRLKEQTLEFIDFLPKKVDWIIGAFMLVRKEIYIKTQGLDEIYFLYCEDMDWCTTVNLLGYDVYYYPKAKIEYVGSRAARSSFYYAKIFIKSLFNYWNKFGFIKIKTKRKIV